MTLHFQEWTRTADVCRPFFLVSFVRFCLILQSAVFLRDFMSMKLCLLNLDFWHRAGPFFTPDSLTAIVL